MTRGQVGGGGLATGRSVPTCPSAPSASPQTWGPTAPPALWTENAQPGRPAGDLPPQQNPCMWGSTDPLSRCALGAGGSILPCQTLGREAEGGLEGPHGEDRPHRGHFPN